MSETLFAEDYRDEPFWWIRTPRPELAAQELPGSAEVVVIGSGYTGLCAAIQTARGGRDTLVLDAEAAGWFNRQPASCFRQIHTVGSIGWRKWWMNPLVPAIALTVNRPGFAGATS